MRKIDFILLAACIAMVCMLIIPKIRSYEHSKPRIGGGPDIRSGIKTALDNYEVDCGVYPKSLQDLVQKPSDATNWHGPYFDPPNLPIDPWGNKYIYEFPGKHNSNGYDLFSAGPDGKAGTEDDIVNWTK